MFLLWDHDGVLVDTDHWFYAATQECLHALAVALDRCETLAELPRLLDQHT
jgi:phosphoglycolate phosphatase-like HAD superfamily hydrolase